MGLDPYFEPSNDLLRKATPPLFPLLKGPRGPSRRRRSERAGIVLEIPHDKHVGDTFVLEHHIFVFITLYSSITTAECFRAIVRT